MVRGVVGVEGEGWFEGGSCRRRRLLSLPGLREVGIGRVRKRAREERDVFGLDGGGRSRSYLVVVHLRTDAFEEEGRGGEGGRGSSREGRVELTSPPFIFPLFFPHLLKK